MGSQVGYVWLAYELSGTRLDYRKIARTTSCGQSGAHLSESPEFQ